MPSGDIFSLPPLAPQTHLRDDTMTTNPSNLALLAEKLNTLGLRWMVTGAAAAAFWAPTRASVDIDIVLDCGDLDEPAFGAALGAEYLVDAEMVRNSVATRRMFNLIPLAGGTKVDVIPLRDEPFEIACFARRRRLVTDGIDVFVETPEDVIVSQLQWAKESLSPRQLADVRALLATAPDLDMEYIDGWVQRLGLQPVVEASREARHDA